jgi:hypothetical protein
MVNCSGCGTGTSIRRPLIQESTPGIEGGALRLADLVNQGVKHIRT